MAENVNLKAVLAAIDAEPELPDAMPKPMMACLKKAVADGDDDLLAEAFRIVVRATKRGIRDRVAAL